MEHCDEHLQQREKIDNINSKMDDLSKDVRDALKYLPKIDSTLTQLVSIEEALKENSKVSQGLSSRLDTYREELYQIKLKLETHDIYINNDKERDRAQRNFKYTVIGGVLIAVILAIGGFGMALYAEHAPNTKVEQTK